MTDQPKPDCCCDPPEPSMWEVLYGSFGKQDDCPACETGGKCPTCEKKAARYCPSCKEKLNQHAPKICPGCKLDLMAWLWDENDRLKAPATMDQLALAVADAEHWRHRAESYESVIDNLRTQRDWAQQVENLTDTALRERIQRLATAADHFWRDRDSWMEQAEARTQDGADVGDWNLKLTQEIEQLKDELADSSLHQRGMVESVLLQEAERKIEQLQSDLADAVQSNRDLTEEIDDQLEEVADLKTGQFRLLQRLAVKCKKPDAAKCAKLWESLFAARAEIDRLKTLAVAVGKCDADAVPPSVIKAWQRPDDYRQDELVRLRDREAELETQVARLTRRLQRTDEDLTERTAQRNCWIKEEAKTKTLLDLVLREIPVGHLPTHTIDRLPEIVRDLADQAKKQTAEIDQLQKQLDAADKTIVKNWSIDEENARLRAQRDELAAANEHLQGWGTVIKTDPGKWLILVSSETDKESAVLQIESQITGFIDPEPLKRVAVCPAAHFDGVKPLVWTTCDKKPKGTP